MPALNFKKQFVAAVTAGTKRQTIRAPRKRPFKVGDTLSFFTGSRFKPVRIRPDAVCTNVATIKIDAASAWIDGQFLNLADLQRLAKADGFPHAIAFCEFFREHHGLPFTGQLIEWGS